MDNPFYGYGRRVTGERFVGRIHISTRLTSYLSTFQGSLSVIGIGRIGKTSLVHFVLNEVMKTQRPAGFIEITVATVPTAADVYNELISGLAASCQRRGITLPAEFDLILRETAPGELYPAFRRCRRALQSLARSGVSTLAVFDEFDAVLDFKDAKLFLQGLRELIDFQDETGFVAVIISRRSLYHIERQVVGLSNLDGVCEKVYLTVLDAAGLRAMISRSGDRPFDEADFQLLQQYTGGHPFLAEMILCRGWDRRSMNAGVEESRTDLAGYNDHLREMLTEDVLFDELLQATVGPVFKLRLEPIERLQRYGIMVQQTSQGGRIYRAWSNHFQLYLEHIAREMPLWSLWHDVETELRWLIRETCRTHYGEAWFSEIASRHPAITRMAHGVPGESDGCLARMERESKNFGQSASSDPLDYTYPLDLWVIVSAEWAHFKAKLGRDKAYWGERFNLLAKVRTPTAHNREHALPNHLLTTAKGYCQELISVLRADASSV